MRRRSRAGSVKPRRRRLAAPKRLRGTKSARPRNRDSSAASQESEAARLASELSATGEILRLISNSPSDLGTVLQSVAEQAAHICQAQFVDIFLVENDNLRDVAWFGELKRTLVFPLDRSTVSGRSVCEMRPVSIDDLQNAGDDLARGREIARRDGHRSILAVPLIREGRAVGTIIIRRTEIRPFEQKNIALLTNFAAQAVIAIENTRLLNELRQRTDDLAESLEQQTATSEVLRTISSSPGELEPVFQAMLDNAVRICDAKFGSLFRFDGNMFRVAAQVGTPLALAEFQRRRGSFQPGPDTPFLDRVMRTKQVSHTVDEAAEAVSGPSAKLGGARSLVGVPMLKDDELIGAILIYRQEVRPFTDKQIALVKNFAAQAVIAIENTRLLNELRESLQQQTATADVLKVISSSPGELPPVFQSMLVKAVQICEAKFGVLFRCYDSEFHAAAWVGVTPEYEESLRKRQSFRPDADAPLGRLLRTKELVHTADELAEKSSSPAAKYGGARSLVAVPMRKDNELVGAFVIYRTEVRPFAAKQIELVQNFAAQAVIAIENTRLLNELRESLEQQTATAEVLRVISSSPTDVQPVFDSIAESAARLCNGQFSFVLRFDGKVMDFASSFGLTAEGLNVFRGMMPRPPGEDTTSGRAVLRRAVVEIPDVNADPAYGAPAQDLARTVAYRSAVSVPLLHEGNPIGAITVARANAGSFPARQIALLQSFADQAVIAIRNVSLFDEVQARTGELSRSVEELRALSEVSQAINSTLDVEAVLTTIVAKAVQLSGTEAGTIYTFDESRQEFRLRATHGMEQTMIAALDDRRSGIGDTAIGKAAAERRPVQIPDVLAESSLVFDIIVRAGFRSLLIVPLLRPDQIVGALVVRRKAAGEFPKSTVDLLQTFAEQSVLAIQNARLFREIEAKSRELEQASQHKSQFLANMSHELRTPLNAILGYTELMADGAYGDPSEKMLGVLKRLESNGKHLLGLINDVLDLSKIEAGQLVLELSDYSIQDIAQTVRSTLEPLAADKKLAFKIEMAPELPPGRGDGRRLTQVLINLVGNAIKFTDAGEVAIKAEANNGSFCVSVRDTGPGISAADQAKLFQEFQQADNAITKKKGGTGLGLAISKRIIEMHGGKIWVESQPRQGSTFTFSLPVVVEQQVNVEPK
jgi:GAF domain-containing protein